MMNTVHDTRHLPKKTNALKNIRGNLREFGLRFQEGFMTSSDLKKSDMGYVVNATTIYEQAPVFGYQAAGLAGYYLSKLSYYAVQPLAKLYRDKSDSKVQNRIDQNELFLIMALNVDDVSEILSSSAANDKEIDAAWDLIKCRVNGRNFDKSINEYRERSLNQKSLSHLGLTVTDCLARAAGIAAFSAAFIMGGNALGKSLKEKLFTENTQTIPANKVVSDKALKANTIRYTTID